MAEGDADSVISPYKKFLEEVVPQNKTKLLEAVTGLINYIMVC